MNTFQRKSAYNLIFAFVDGILILTGIALGGALRHLWAKVSFFQDPNLVGKCILVLFVAQMIFYYFDLYEMRTLKNRVRTLFLLLEAMGVSAILLSVIYFFAPDLAIGRGVFAISFCLTISFAFAWRMLFYWIMKQRLFRERVLIVGTGVLANKIISEINEHGEIDYEIVGYLDRTGKIVKTVGETDGNKEIQSDLFVLSKRTN